MRARNESWQAHRLMMTLCEIVDSDLANARELNQALSMLPSGRGFFASWIETPLGAMLAVVDDKALCLLEFHDRHNLSGALRRAFGPDITRIGAAKQTSSLLTKLEKELSSYFLGKLKQFSVPTKQAGTEFQQAAWLALNTIPYGETRSYQEQAHVVGKPLAHRAVANANGRNKIAVVIPCHRIIRHDGSLGGYGGRVDRKKWLLDLEQRGR